MAKTSLDNRAQRPPKSQRIEGEYAALSFSLSDKQKAILQRYAELKKKSISNVICQELNFKKLLQEIEDLK